MVERGIIHFMYKRTLAREKALQMLYQWELRGKEFIPEPRPDGHRGEGEPDNTAQEYTQLLVQGVVQNLDKINGAIKQVADHWAIDRMTVLDRNILRIGAYEIIFRADIPKAVAINEAVELARKYSSADAPAFVNGILDKIPKPEQPCSSVESEG